MKRKRLVGPVLAAVAFALTFLILWFVVSKTTDLSPVTWLGTLPVVAIFAIAVVFWCLFALIVWWIAERAISEEEREVSHESVARILVVMTSFFVFMLGFVVSQEWSNATQARNYVSQGTAALYTAGYNAYPLPKSSVAEIQPELDRLGLSIACQDIPTLEATGKGAPQTGIALSNAFKVVTNQPQSIQEMVTFGNIVDELGALSKARREWVSQAANGLPGVLLVAIMLVSGFLLAAFVVQSTRSRKTHLATVIGLALLVSLGTGLVISLARPFAGAAQVDPSAFSQGRKASSAENCAGFPR